MASEVYSNSYNGVIGPFNSSSSYQGNVYGESINLTSAQNLQSWSFYFQASSKSTAGNVNLEIVAWNPATDTLVGPALYYSPTPFYWNGGTETVTFNNINTRLITGSYMIYATNIPENWFGQIPGAMNDPYIATSQGAGIIGTGAYQTDPAGNDPITLEGTAWTSSNTNLQFSTTMTAASAVYAPQSAGLALLGVIGVLLFERKRRAIAG